MRVRTLYRKFRALPWRERAAVAKAALWLLGTRAALRLLPFRTVLGWAEGPDPGSGPEPDSSAPFPPGTQRHIRAIDAVGHRLFPRNPCLTQAVLVQRHLRRRGHASELRIGVRKGATMNLEAHAWVECRGEVVIGSRGMAEDHVPLPSLLRPRPDAPLPRGRRNVD